MSNFSSFSSSEEEIGSRLLLLCKQQTYSVLTKLHFHVWCFFFPRSLHQESISSDSDSGDLLMLLDFHWNRWRRAWCHLLHYSKIFLKSQKFGLPQSQSSQIIAGGEKFRQKESLSLYVWWFSGRVTTLQGMLDFFLPSLRCSLVVVPYLKDTFVVTQSWHVMSINTAVNYVCFRWNSWDKLFLVLCSLLSYRSLVMGRPNL